MTQPPRSTAFDDVYFSADGGPEETLHVFLNGNNLPAAWQGRERFAIGETGFGTGLNFLLAWEAFDRTAAPGAFLDFVSVEKFPLSAQEIKEGLSPWAERLEPYLSKMLAQYPIRVPGFHRMVFDNRVALTLIFDDANDAFPEIEGGIDAWFLDGFTPAKNPDMWTDTLFSEMARLSHPNASFATFTAAGFVKRGLQGAGFSVEKKKGFGRKRDMMAGRYQGVSHAPELKGSRAIDVLGAGLAGTSAAHVLRQYGFVPTLYDPNGIASGASGNPVGIINPRFSAHRTAESDFYTAAFAQTVRSFSSLANIDYAQCGALHLMVDSDKENRFAQTVGRWGWHADHMRLVDVDQASAISGIPQNKGALYLPNSARLNPQKLCLYYADGVEIRKDVPSDVRGAIHASGASIAKRFPNLPVQTVRGQISFAQANAASANIKTNICYGGYISPSMASVHVVGSTFQKWLTHTDVLDEDHVHIMDQLISSIPSLQRLDNIGGRAALRVASQDRFPVIGPYDESLISAAHGSHGIATSLMGAHLLVDILRGGIRSLGKSTIKALSPDRFELRAARKRSSG